MIKIRLLAAALLLSISYSFAQPGKIDTDRPDQTESPVTVPKKWVQLEMGFSLQQNTRTENEFLLPTLLCKYGLSKRIELRLITSVNHFAVAQSPSGTKYETGLEPIELGTKIALVEEKKWIPKTSVLLHLAIPTFATKNLHADHVAPSFKISMQNTLSKILGLGYNIGVEWNGFSTEPAWIYTISPGFNIGEKWYAYIEVFGAVTKNEIPQHNIDGGLAFYVNDNIKLDLSSGVGLTKTSPDWYLAIGGSIRFKTGK